MTEMFRKLFRRFNASSRASVLIKRAIERLAAGDLAYRINPTEAGGLDPIASSLNKMAGNLENDFLELRAQKNELDRVLANLQQGVVAISSEQNVVWLNRSAAALLGVSFERAVGRSVQEVLRNIDLQDFTARALAARTSIDAEILLYSEGEKSIQLYSSVLPGIDNESSGVLIVLNDVTRLKQLENLRRDFVANVSHELKTPITSIKGFVETLLDGAMHNKEETKRFLGIVARQADRLNAIFDDLLSLAHMEQAKEAENMGIESAPVRTVIQSAVQGCELKARAKNIAVSVECDPNLTGTFNPSLLEQALINLLDNAIKYSNAGGRVEIRGMHDGEALRLEVIDSGPGIERSHLARVFERFYRVDPARSRQQGGTGLGLAIVKHVALLHGGSASVESSPGKGSKFMLYLPMPEKLSSQVA